MQDDKSSDPFILSQWGTTAFHGLDTDTVPLQKASSPKHPFLLPFFQGQLFPPQTCGVLYKVKEKTHTLLKVSWGDTRGRRQSSRECPQKQS